MAEHLLLQSEFIPQTIQRLTEVLASGGIACVPTDTVYGLVWKYANHTATERVYAIKERSKDKPFTLFTDTPKRLERLPIIVSEPSRKCMDSFWPGALTIVFPTKGDCWGAVDGKIGIRCPRADWIRSVIQQLDSFLLNTSFNESGKANLLEVSSENPLLNEIDLFIDRGRLTDSQASTVIDCTCDEYSILREGAIKEEELRKVLVR